MLAVPPRRPRRLVYLGTPALAVPPLRALVDAGHDVALVVSRADARRGRGGSLVPSPVKAAALELGLPVTDRVDDVLAVGADLGVVVAYGRLIKPHVLAELAMVNLHFSLLPCWRGAAPVERAILAGDRETGVCVMALEEGLDTGPVYRRAVEPIGADDTLDELRGRLVTTGTALLLGLLRDGVEGAVTQEGEPTYAAKIDPAELELRWSHRAVELHRVVRVGGAHTSFRGQRLKVWRTTLDLDAVSPPLAPGELTSRKGEGLVRVGAGDGSVLGLLEVQPEGKARMAAAAWWAGARPSADDRLGA
jgi:methionyl-tRNA formyltransferase